MQGLADIGLPTLTGILWLALDLAVKATLLIAGVALLARLLRQPGQAAARAAMWHATVAGLLIIPLVAVLAPPIDLPLLPAPRPPPPPPEPALYRPDVIEWSRTSAVLHAHANEDGLLRTIVPGPNPLPIDSMMLLASAPAWRHVEPPRPIEETIVALWPPLWQFAGAAGVIAIYVGGAIFLLLRLAASIFAVQLLRGSVVAIVDQRWLEECTGWRAALCIRRSVRLAESTAISAPVTVGLLRPIIVVPSALAESAGVGDRDAILLHELCHVRRCDYVWQLLGRAVSAVFWPLPPVWWMRREIASAREDAVDQLCVEHLGGPRQYCRTLIDVAGAQMGRAVAARGVAMSSGSAIGRRLANLDPDEPQPETRHSRIACVLISVMTLGAASGLAAVRVTPTAAAAPADVEALRPVQESWPLGDIDRAALLAPGRTARRIAMSFLDALAAGDIETLRAVTADRLSSASTEKWRDLGTSLRVAYGWRAGPGAAVGQRRELGDHTIVRSAARSTAADRAPHSLVVVLRHEPEQGWRVISLSETPLATSLAEQLETAITWAATPPTPGPITPIYTPLRSSQ